MGLSVFPAPGGGVTQKVDVFTSTGTWTAPSNCSSVEVFLVGGGGGGGGVTSANDWVSGGGGGGGGGVVRRTIAVTPGTSYTITIGGGGAGGTNGATAGAVGGDTTFGSLVTAFGGGGACSFTDSTNTMVLGTARATSGSLSWGQQSFGATSFAGAAGGAGGHGTLSWYNSSWNVGRAIINVQTSALQGGIASPIAQDAVAQGGLGIDGYGGGGVTGTRSLTYGAATVGSTSGGGANVNNNSNPVNTNGNAGTANTGGGGSGCSRFTNPGGAASGGNGGSGFARITYWS